MQTEFQLSSHIRHACTNETHPLPNLIVLIPTLAVCSAVPANVGIKSRIFARKSVLFVQKI